MNTFCQLAAFLVALSATQAQQCGGSDGSDDGSGQCGNDNDGGGGRCGGGGDGGRGRGSPGAARTGGIERAFSHLPWGACVVDKHGASTCSSYRGRLAESSLCTIDRIPAAELTAERFFEHYDGKRPLIVTASTGGWRARETHSLDALLWDRAGRWRRSYHEGTPADYPGELRSNFIVTRRTHANHTNHTQIDEGFEVDPSLRIDPRVADAVPFFDGDYKSHAWCPNFLQTVRQVGDEHVVARLRAVLARHMAHLAPAEAARRVSLGSVLWRYARAQNMPHIYHIVSSELSGSPWHTDPAKTSFWNTLVQGRKHWFALPPRRENYDEEGYDYGNGPPDVFVASHLPRWNHAAAKVAAAATGTKGASPMPGTHGVPGRAAHVECMQQEGDTVYIPKEWKHMAIATRHSTGISEQAVTRRNFKSYVAWHHRNAIKDCKGFNIDEALRGEAPTALIDSEFLFSRFMREAMSRKDDAGQASEVHWWTRVATFEMVCAAAKVAAAGARAANAATGKHGFSALEPELAAYARKRCQSFHTACADHLRLFELAIVGMPMQERFRAGKGAVFDYFAHTGPGGSDARGQPKEMGHFPALKAELPSAVEVQAELRKTTKAAEDAALDVLEANGCPGLRSWLTPAMDHAVAGFHVLCLQQSTAPSATEKGSGAAAARPATVFHTFKWGVLRSPAVSKLRAPRSLTELRAHVERVTGIVKGPNSAKARAHQTKRCKHYAGLHRCFVPHPWRMYGTLSGGAGSKQGNFRDSAIATVDSLRKARSGVVLVFEGGTFMYPGIKAGYERVLPGLPAQEGEEAGAETAGEPLKLVTVSMVPLIFRVDGFAGVRLSTALRERAAAQLAKDGYTVDAPFAASTLGWGVDGGSGADAALEELSARVAALTGLPVAHQEPAFASRAGAGLGGKSTAKPFFDTWDVVERQRGNSDVELLTEGGTANRGATLLLPLTTPAKGGQLGFPDAQGVHSAHGAQTASCNHQLVLPSRAGSAYLLYNLLADGRNDGLSQRAECPMLEGQKWTVTKWVWNKPLAISE